MSDLGATPRTVAFDVEGMTCVACARRVEKALAKVEGVRDAKVDLVRERVAIDLDATREIGAELEGAAERAGYRLVRRSDGLRPAKRAGRASRAAVALVLTVLAMVAAALSLPWIEVALAAAAVLGAGSEIFAKAWADVRGRALGMDVLVALGAGAALVSSVLSLLSRGTHAAHPMAHSDASMAALIVAVALLGKTLERAARAKAADAIESIVRAMPDTARVVRHGVEGELAVGEVREGDEVHVAPFARVPVDGVLSDDDAERSLDESVVTGESRPVTRRTGDRLLGGSVNLGRALVLRASVGGEGSELAKVIAAVTRASSERSPTVRVTDRVVSIFVPAVLAAATLTLVGWLATGATLDLAVRTAISVLVVACPCALGLATPVAVTVAIGHLASRGVLVRDAAVLETLPRVKTLVLDKTGTLTVGAPRVIASVRAADATDSDDVLLALAASVESESHHPLARAIFEEAMRRRLAVPRASALEEIAGRGVRGRVNDREIAVVRPEPSNDGRFALPEGITSVASVVEVLIDGGAVARVFLEDALRDEAREVIDTLRARGVLPVIRSGDAPSAVAHVARALGIEDARGGLRPEDKLADLRGLRRPILMVGDGINDAPALAKADVGVSLGARTETALRAAGIALPRADLRLVTFTHELATRLARVVRENLALAFAYNALAIPFAALGAFDRIGGPAAAAIAMAGSSLLVVLNALRLRARSGVMSRA
ncbi:MAG: cadmium-translocating P-type ATPase [Deltaproteobacteria bacterium]|nr:cadmium-translocating P-type ATPase [Deltaproteobacteria bacterium]